MTALGPALVISIFLASKLVGSRVVLCTDGCANVGVGSLESNSAAAPEFYETLGATASSKGSVRLLRRFDRDSNPTQRTQRIRNERKKARNKRNERSCRTAETEDHWRRQLWGTGARAPPSTSS